MALTEDSNMTANGKFQQPQHLEGGHEWKLLLEIEGWGVKKHQQNQQPQQLNQQLQQLKRNSRRRTYSYSGSLKGR